jgi:hypothetical protein
MGLRGVVENEGTGIGIRATAQILEFCRDQKLGYRPRENGKSQVLAFEQRPRSMEMKTFFTLDKVSLKVSRPRIRLSCLMNCIWTACPAMISSRVVLRGFVVPPTVRGKQVV